MVVVIGIVVALGVVLIWATYAERLPPPSPTEHLPPWHDFPSSADIRRAGFRLSPLGYDQKAVHLHLARVAAAFDTAMTAREAVDTLNHRDSTPDALVHREAPVDTPDDRDIILRDPVDPSPDDAADA